MSTVPYTYYLYHIPTKKRYYGVRYRKGCSPKDLWTTYFSSSPLVHQLIEEYGKDSFVPNIRKTFSTPEQAVAWESKFLTKVKAQHNDEWLNRHNGKDLFIGPHIHSPAVKAKISKTLTGIKRSEETKIKLREKAKIREAKRREQGWQYPPDAQVKAIATRRARISSGEINPYSEERNKKMSASKKGTKRQYLPDGSFIMVKPQVDQ